MKALLVRICAVMALAIPLALAQPAGAATAPNLACGDTQSGPCQETAHFSNINDLNTPAPPGGGCPAFLSTDYFSFVGTGNGVEHINLNKAQDGWFTSTFTGTITITGYQSAIVDADGNVTSVSNPDGVVLTGKITQWFGGSFNKQSSVIHGTINISGTINGQSLRIHFDTHASWTPGTDPNGAPHTAFDKITCS
jgi:hypothetical protein